MVSTRSPPLKRISVGILRIPYSVAVPWQHNTFTLRENWASLSRVQADRKSNLVVVSVDLHDLQPGAEPMSAPGIAESDRGDATSHHTQTPDPPAPA
eukprot:924596-Rhodomonas_salina.1